MVIPGNHDCNLKINLVRMYFTVVDLVQKINPNLLYWKKTGVYDLGGCKFGLLSFDITKDNKPNVRNLPKAKDIKVKTKIAFITVQLVHLRLILV